MRHRISDGSAMRLEGGNRMKKCSCCKKSDKVVVLMCKQIHDRGTGKVLATLTRYFCLRCDIRWDVLNKGEAKNG